MLAGCYTLDLYCDSDEGHPADYGFRMETRDGAAQFTGETSAEAKRTARQAGWRLGEKEHCPRHNGKKRGGSK